MTTAASDDVFALLAAARQGDAQAAARTFELLYGELKRLASARLRKHRTFTLLDTTSLVHESFLKLVGAAPLPVTDRHHFFAYASRVMRSVIVDHARARSSGRRGGDAEHVALDTDLAERIAAEPEDVIDVDQALQALAQAEPELARLVEMRYFGGLTEAETAEALRVSERTVRRQWAKARLLLLELMGR